MNDLYREAVIEGIQQYRIQTQTGDGIALSLTKHVQRIPTAFDQSVVQPIATQPVLGPEGPGYWIARHAARQAVLVLLEEATRLGLSEDKQEALRVVAAEVAYD